LEVAISELPDNYITAKRKLREEYNPQITQLNQELLEYKTRRADLEIELVSTGVDVGPAIYLARTFGTDIDTVVKFFIFILIFVFDPLAVMLVIAYNQALIDRTKRNRDVVPAGGSINKQYASAWWKRLWEMYGDKKDEEPNPNPYGDDDYATPTPQEDTERMDIIGQNGNDGLHYDISDQDLIDDDVEPREENDPQPKRTLRGGVKAK